MPKELNALLIRDYAKRLKAQDSFLFIQYQMSAEATAAFRQRLREADLTMLVIKNRLADLAFKEVGIEGVGDVLKGKPAAVLFGGESGAIAAAKLVHDFSRDGEAAEIRGGIMEGALAGATEADTWKDFLTRDEQLAALVAQILSPGAALASQLVAPGGALASQIEVKASE